MTGSSTVASLKVSIYRAGLNRVRATFGLGGGAGRTHLDGELAGEVTGGHTVGHRCSRYCLGVGGLE
jgi:hypothetical protein